MSEKRNSFVMYTEYKEHLKLLTPEQLGTLIFALFEYAENGTEISTDNPVEKIAFSFIRAQMDRDNEKYLKICERNRENGKGGGRPKKNPVGFLETEKTLNDNDNYNKNKNKNDNKNYNKNDNEHSRRMLERAHAKINNFD